MHQCWIYTNILGSTLAYARCMVLHFICNSIPELKKNVEKCWKKDDFPDVCMTPYDKIMAANVEFNRFSPAISDLLYSIFVLYPWLGLGHEWPYYSQGFFSPSFIPSSSLSVFILLSSPDPSLLSLRSRGGIKGRSETPPGGPLLRPRPLRKVAAKNRRWVVMPLS